MRPTDRNRFRKDAEAKFQIKVDVPVPPGGLGRRLTGMLAWCRERGSRRVGGARPPGAQEGERPADFARFYCATEAGA